MSPRLRPRSLARRAFILLTVAAVVGCSPNVESPSVPPSGSPSVSSPVPSTGGATPVPTTPTTPVADTCPTPPLIPKLPAEATPSYDEIEGQVVGLRGLQPRAEVTPEVLDDAGIKQITSDSFRRDNPPDVVAANERILKGLGLIDEGASLEDLYLKMLGSQVAGLYDPETKKMYVVSKSGSLGPTEKTTFAHEYTHALQDQNFELSSFDLAEVGEGDRGFARLSLIEGDATLLMTLWQLDRLTQAEFIQLLGEASDPEATKILSELPPVLVQSLLFPYTGGLNFVECLYANGGWTAVDAAYRDPPASTEQILHPAKYLAHEAPIAVDLPDDLATRLGDGWSVGLEDTTGELQLRLWLQFAGGGSAGPVEPAAAGWGGDRTMLLKGPDGAWAIVISTEWDTPADASEFVARAKSALTAMPHPGEADGPVGRTTATVVVASTDDLVGRVQNVLGLAG